MKLTEKLPGENARMYAHRMILDNIINLELPPGSAVSENELSATLNLSRTPVREALIEMSRLGLIEILPQKGSFVTKIDSEVIEESKFIRLSLENAVIRLGCKEGIPDHYVGLINDNLKREREAMEKHGEYNTLIEMDNEFHKLLFEAVNKQRTYEFIKSQMVHFDRLRTLTYKYMQDLKITQTVCDHENIMYALQKRDAELAEIVMTLHLTRHQIEIKELLKLCPDYFA